MIPQLPRVVLLAVAGSLLATIPLLDGCSRSKGMPMLRGSAPGLSNEDSPVHSKIGTNPNAPYLVAASKPPQLMKRSDQEGSSTEPCQTRNLSVTEIAASMNGNFHAVKLAFGNQGLTPCRIGGFPSVSLLNQGGDPVASLAVERVSASALKAKLEQGTAQPVSDTPSQAQIVVAPRGEAWFQIGWSTGDGCPAVSRISVTAPGSSETFTVNHPLSVCDGHIEITSLRADDNT